MDRLADVAQGLKQKRVAIVGGGWAGLTAAVELCAAGVPIILFEAARQLGGRARRVDIAGHALDNGQHILIGAYRQTLRLMRRVGAEPERLLKRLPLDIDQPASAFRLRLPNLPAPLHLACGLLAAKGCPLAEKIAAARFMRALQNRAYRLAEDIPVAELLDRERQGGALRRLLWEPLCLAALNTPPERASAQIFANVLRDSLGGRRDDTDLLLPAAALDHLFPDAAAAFIAAHGGEIRLSARVERIERAAGQWRIGGGTYDHLIIATAPQHAGALLAGWEETQAVAALLAAYDYEPIATVFAAYPAEIGLPKPMLGLSSAGEERLGQWAFDRGRLCNDPGMIALVLSAHGRGAQRDADDLMRTLHGELEKTLRRTLPQPIWHKTLCERRATFSCRPQLPRPPTKTPLGGLWLAGDYVCADFPATLEGAVRSGSDAAHGILAKVGQ